MIQVINEIPYEVDEKLKHFTIQKKKSSNVDIFGIADDQLFVQFLKSGWCYLYSGLDITTIKELQVADSVGVFVSNQIIKKFPSERLADNMVKQLPRATVLLKSDIVSGLELLGKKHDEVYLVNMGEHTCTVENMATGNRYQVKTGETLKKAS